MCNSEKKPIQINVEDFLNEKDDKYLSREAENYLKSQGIPRNEEYIAILKSQLRAAGYSDGIQLAQFDFNKESGRIGAETNHRLNSRRRIVDVLRIPMLLIPIWLMVILTVPAFGNKAYSERMQICFLGALATNALGLCYIVTRDLFPKGSEGQDEDAPNTFPRESASVSDQSV